MFVDTIKIIVYIVVTLEDERILTPEKLINSNIKIPFALSATPSGIAEFFCYNIFGDKSYEKRI